MKKELDKELYPDYVYPEFTPDPGKPFREPIAKLGKKITDRIPQKLGLKKITRNDPEYWGLAGVLTDEEALLALKLGVRKPKTLSEIVKIFRAGREKNVRHFWKKCHAKDFSNTTGKMRHMRSSMSCRCMYRDVRNSLI